MNRQVHATHSKVFIGHLVETLGPYFQDYTSVSFLFNYSPLTENISTLYLSITEFNVKV